MKKKERRREEREREREELVGKRNERKRGARVWNTAGFHNLISTWSSLLDSWNLVVSKVERDTTTTTTHLPVKFVFERGRGVDIEQFSNCLAQRLCIIVPSSF